MASLKKLKIFFIHLVMFKESYFSVQVCCDFFGDCGFVLFQSSFP